MEFFRIRIVLFIYFLIPQDSLLGQGDHSYENSIILTTVPTVYMAGWIEGRHIIVIPGTPYDLARNQSYYSAYFHLTKTNQINSAKPHGCKVDYSRKVMYMYDEAFARIEAIPNFDWSNEFQDVTSVVRMHVGVSVGYVKLAIDWVSHNIYWTDPLFRWIGMQPANPYTTDTSLYKIIIKEDLEKPYGLAVDPIDGFLFWTEISKYPKIERASLTGENRQVIVSSGLLFPICIDVDVTGSDRKIYWADTFRDTVETATLSGENRRIIRRMSHTEFFDMAVFRNILSVVDVREHKVFFIDKLDGHDAASPYTRQYEDIWGICMYDDETQPPLTDYCSSAQCSELCVNDGGKATCLCREGLKLASDGYTCIEDTSKYHRALVLADSHAIYLADVRCLTASFSTYPHTQIYNTTQTIKFLTVDMVDRKIIFATATEIYSLQLDVTSPQAQHIVSSNYTITGLSLDWIDKNVYWTSGTSSPSGRISVVAQTGGASFTLQTGLDNARGLKILALEEKMVWISGATYSSKIEISNLDGTQRNVLVQSTQLSNFKSLEFDSDTNKLYWVDSGGIKRVNIDGSGLEDLNVSAVAPNLFLVYKDYIVWTEDQSSTSTIVSAYRRNPETRIHSDIFVNVSLVVALGVLDKTLQPSQKGPCQADNGNCEHICIPVGRIGICKCEYGFKIDSNGRTCSSEPLYDNFLLVTDWSHNKIYQVSLINDSDVRAVDVDSAGNPNAVIYDPVNKRVIWGDTKDQSIHSAHLNGSYDKKLVYNGVTGSFADRLAIDSTSGNLYYTSASLTQDGSGFKGVSVISPKGDKRHLITDGYVPRDIVFDPSEGLMFWTDHGTVPTVKRANMDGTASTVIISSNIFWPNGIAIDYQAKILYVTDGQYNTIQRCTYSGYCTTIHTDPGAHLMDIELSGQYLYYTAWNRPYITKMNKAIPTNITLLATNAELGRLDSISIYSSSAVKQPVNDNCSPDQGLGDCSTLCLPTSTGRTCTCEDGVSLWPGSTICQDIPKCSSTIGNGQITGSCSYLPMSNCSYSCNSFYRPATGDSMISCSNGQWNVQTPCIYSVVKCSATVDKVTFDPTCTFNNGATCRYNCSHGYTPTASGSTLTCDGGLWTNQNPCQALAPDCPTTVAHVIFSDLCLFQNSEQCTYSCDAGYFATSGNINCVAGAWNFHTPCEAIKCSNTTDKVVFNDSCSFTDGSVCTYTCVSGYNPTSSSRTLTCRNGAWDNSRPCEVITCPSTIAKVSFDAGCSYTYGSSCRYTCDYGYTPIESDRTITCLNGGWDNGTPCELKRCVSAVSKVSFGTCSFTHGTTCGYTCAYGYTPTSSSLTCVDGTWNNTNPCELKQCTAAVTKVSFDACTYTHGTSCTYTCVSGYTPSLSNRTLACVNGNWNSQTPCKQITCSATVDKVTFGSDCQYTHGSSCTYTCVTGYTPTESDRTLTCNNGNWDNENPCQQITCSATVDKVSFTPGCQFTHGSSCTYTCVSGYKPTESDNTLTCNSGIWDNQRPCEQITCTTSVEKVIFLSGCQFTHGFSCSYTCVSGYTPSASDRTLTCNNGTWDIASPCKQITCSSTVEKVLFDPGCQFTHGSSCTYTCVSGYTPAQSDRTLTCNSGIWDSENPCKLLKCPSDIANGQITGSCSYLHLSNCSYSCNTFYEAATDNSVVSCANGQWNVQNPCIFSDAKCSATVESVTFDASCTFDNGATCRYNCMYGYTQIASTLTCDRGSWNHQNPCLEIEPDCPTEVDHVVFSNLCLFQSSEQCTFSCENGYFAVARSMICVTDNWNIQTPCEIIKCPNSVDKVIFNDACQFTTGSTCAYACVNGYKPASTSHNLICNNGVWDNSNPCEVITCPRTVPHVTFEAGCSNTYGRSCSYSCEYGYSPTDSGGFLTCYNATWDNSNPCELKRCTNAVSKVSFSTCSFTHGATCSYTCAYGYTPTSFDNTLRCVDGAWDSNTPCEPKTCPVSVAKVSFDACAYTHGSSCSYSCVSGYRPTGQTLTCDNGKWNNDEPCEQITTTTSSTTSTSAAPPPQKAASTEAQVQSIAPVAAGAGVGGLVLVAVIVILICVIFRRTRKTRETKQTDKDPCFEDPSYQGFDDLATVSSGVSQRPDSTYDRVGMDRDSTYDLIKLDDYDDLKGVSELSCPNLSRRENDYTSMSKRGGVALSGEYESLNRDSSDYLEPVASVKMKSNLYDENVA